MVLIFDGTCGFCTACISWLRARDRHGRVLALPGQAAGVREQYGVTRAEADRSIWTIDRQGRRCASAAAVTRVIWELGGVWRILAALYQVPPIGWIQERVYHWVSGNRHWLSKWFGVTPECERPGVACQ